MSIWPAVIAWRTTEVAPSWIFSVTGTLFACSTCEMMLPSRPPSVAILDDTTTLCALARVVVRATVSAAAAIFVSRRIVVSLVSRRGRTLLDFGRVWMSPPADKNWQDDGSFRAKGPSSQTGTQAASRRIEISVVDDDFRSAKRLGSSSQLGDRLNSAEDIRGHAS